MNKYDRYFWLIVVSYLLVLTTIAIASISEASAIYSGESTTIDLTGLFTSIDNCTSSIPVNFSVSGVTLQVTAPVDFEGNITFFCSGMNDVSTHTTDTVYVGGGGGGGGSYVIYKNNTVYRNNTVYSNNTVDRIVYVPQNSTSTGTVVPNGIGWGLTIIFIIGAIIVGAIIGVLLTKPKENVQ